MDSKTRTLRIKRASWIGIIINGLLSLLKILAGFFSHSFALIGDGIDSSVDVLTSFVTLFTAGIAARPPDMAHPYGHGRAETIASKLVAFIIFFAGAQLALSSVNRMFVHSEEVPLPGLPAFLVLLLSIAGKLFLSIYKMRVGKQVNSAMIVADAKNMRSDVLISASVLAGLVFTVVLHLPVLDAVLALAVSLWIMKTALGIFMETSREIMDGVDDADLYRSVFSIVRTVEGAGNPHKTRIRKLNNMYIIDMDIEVDGNMSVIEGHAVAMEVEKAVRASMADIYDVNVHVEPTGNTESRESFGLSEKNIDDKEQKL